jgi:hypothetical protein
MIGAAKSTFNFPVLVITALIVGGTYLFFWWRDNQAQAMAAQWIMQTPQLAMVAERDVSLAPVLKQRFIEPYKQFGDEGLQDTLIGVQQLLLATYLGDFVWQYDDAAIRAYLLAQLAVVQALQAKAQAREIRLCESFLRDGELHQLVQDLVGADKLAAYTKAGEVLLLSAQRNTVFNPLPNADGYTDKLRAALMNYAAQYKQIYPRSPLPNAAAIASVGNRACSQLAPELFVLLKLPAEQMSILWRNGVYRSAASFAAAKARLKGVLAVARR